MCCTEEGATFTVVAILRSVEGARLQRPRLARYYCLVGGQEAPGGLRSLPVCIFDMAFKGRGFGSPPGRLFSGHPLAPVRDQSDLWGSSEGVFHRHGRSALGWHLVRRLGRINLWGPHLRVADLWLAFVRDRLFPVKGLCSFRPVRAQPGSLQEGWPASVCEGVSRTLATGPLVDRSRWDRHRLSLLARGGPQSLVAAFDSPSPRQSVE